MSKKIILPLLAAGLMILAGLSSCNKERFIDQLVGDWDLKFFFVGDLNKTPAFDSAQRSYFLRINENNSYSESWTSYTYTVNTIRDTVYLDSVNYVVNVSTLRDSVGRAVQTQGRWDLINSDENLQLKDDSSRAVRIFRITEKTKSKMKLRLGEEEYQFEKK